MNENLSFFLDENPKIKLIIDKCLQAHSCEEAAKAREITRKVLRTTSLPGKPTDCSEGEGSTLSEIFLVREILPEVAKSGRRS